MNFMPEIFATGRKAKKYQNIPLPIKQDLHFFKVNLLNKYSPS